MVVKKLTLTAACITAILLLTSAFCSASAWVGLDQVAEAILQPDGTQVELSPMFVDMILGDYVVVRDLTAGSVPIPVYLGEAGATLFSTVSISGRMATVGSQCRRVLIADDISIYTTSDGRVSPPIPWLDTETWPYIFRLPITTAPTNGDALPPVPNPPAPATSIRISAPEGSVAEAKIGPEMGSIRAASIPKDAGAIQLEGKVVTAVFYVPSTQTVDYFYIQETDMPSGIKVDPQGSMSVSVAPGDVVSVSGTVVGASVPECYIDPTSVTKTGMDDIPKPLFLTQKSAAGGAFGDQPALCRDTTITPAVYGSGLNAVGTRVRVCGKVTYVSQDGTVCFLDDGSNLKCTYDSGERTGIMLIYPSDSPGLHAVNDYLSGITGILGAETVDGEAFPVVRCGRLSVRITSPPGGTMKLISGAPSAAISAVAESRNSGIASVKMAVTTGSTPTSQQWNSATYSSSAGVWTWNWPSPTSGNKYIWVRAYDLAGNVVQASRSVTVSTLSNIIFVDVNATGANTGLNWEDAKTTVSTGIGAASTLGYFNIWVAEGTYPAASIAPRANMKLYGGFKSGDTYLEQRNWRTNETVLTGPQSGSSAAVNVNDFTQNTSNYYSIDGFTIRAGIARGVLYSTTFVGARTLSVRNCVLENNNGGGLYSSLSSGTDQVHVTGCIFKGNTAATYGSAIHLSGSGVSNVTNCTIVVNRTTGESMGGSGGAIYRTGTGTAFITNNIVAFNSSGIRTNGTSAGTYNCVYGNPCGNFIGTSTVYTSNIVADPMFADLDSGDYHLTAASPCIDVGYNSAYQIPDLDMDLGDRMVGTVDIGVDEADSSSPYYRGLDADRVEVPVGESAKITAGAAIRDTAVQWLQGCQMTFFAPSGTLTVSNNGLTGSDGRASAILTSNTAETITVTVSVTAPFGKTTTKTIDITFFSGSAREDWPMFHHDIALTGVTSASVGANPANMSEKWSVTLNGNSTSGEVHWSSPVVYDGVVYVGTSTGTTGWLYAMDTVSGSVLAKLDLGSPVIGTPCVHNGVIYVPTQQGGWLNSDGYWYDVGRVIALKLNRTTNVLEPQWEYVCPNAGEQVKSSTTVYDGAVFFGAYSTGYEVGHTGVLRTLDLITHTDRSGSPAVTKYEPLCVTPCIDKDYVNPSTSQPEPRVYVSDYSCYVTAVECATGGKVWEEAWDGLSMYASPTAYLGYVFVGSDYSCLYKLEDIGDDSPGGVGQGHVWMFSQGLTQVRSTSACYNGKLFFGCNNGYIYRLGASAFTATDSSRNLTTAVSSSPAVSATTAMLFVASSGGTLYALNTSDLADNQMYRSIDLSGRLVHSSPALISSRAFVVAGDSSNRYLYCIGD